MEKDTTILKLIERLKQEFDFTRLRIVDHWPADLCAIGIQKENKLVYISTFNYIDKKELKYDYDLELIDPSDETNFEVLKEGLAVTESELIKEVNIFLEL